jgi:hypothetical protein
MRRLNLYSCALAVALIFSANAARAQSAADFQALEKQIQDLQGKVDKLQREQADSTVSYSSTSAAEANAIEENKVKLAAGVTEMKLYGDLRFRYQYDQFHPLVDVPNQVTDDRNRYRFRLRIGADVQLGDQFFAGVTLATAQSADSNNQTYTEGYDNYNIFIDKAFAGWTPNDWSMFVIGKQANPFYTTELVWDPSITPQGLTESVDLSKAFLPDDTKWSIQLLAMQGAFYGGGSFTGGSDTAWQFVEQLRTTYNFNKNLSVTFAPGYMTYTAASLTGLQNSGDFSKTTDELTAPNGVQVQTTTTTTETETIKYDATGKPAITITPVNTTTTVTTTTPATGSPRAVTTTASNNQTQVTIPFGAKGNPLKANPKLANEAFVSTKTVGGGSTTVTTPTGEAPAQETRDLSIITAPGDVSFRIDGLAAKVYWDFAYNTEGQARATNEYFLAMHSTEDDIAWLVGFQLGDNIKAGDWSISANYRRVGMDSIDPNLNESNFALSDLNVHGIKVSLAYNFTDSMVGDITYYHSWLLDKGITGGEATGGAALGNGKNVDVLQLDLNLKF